MKKQKVGSNGLTKVEEGIYRSPIGAYSGVVRVGQNPPVREYFAPGTDIKEVRVWRLQKRADLLKVNPTATPGTLRADVAQYLAHGAISPTTRKRRKQQLAWWCAQLADFGARVFSPEEVLDNIAAVKDARKRRTLGDMRRSSLDPKRLREVLAVAFAPSQPEVDPYEFGSTANHYRTALLHLYSELDQDNAGAVNPLRGVKVRAARGAVARGQDPRVIADILRLSKAARGRPGDLSQVRLPVLAWVHITPTQLMACDPSKDFHDVADATFADICDGAITLTKQPRLKGRKNRPLPPPETIPLNPWGVAAMRAFKEKPEAWGKFSMSSMNKLVKRGAALAHADYAQRGVTVDGVRVDLADFSLYHLKHSLASAASVASAGLVDLTGKIQQSAGVSRALDHTSKRTTSIYTQAAVNPLVREVNRRTTLFLEQLFKEPLTISRRLKRVS